MESRVKQAEERHNKGYNCAQSVACTYCDLVGIDEKTMFKLTEGLGAGLGAKHGTCGAVTGATIVLSMLNSTGNIEVPNSKQDTYKVVGEFTTKFLEDTGSLACNEIKEKPLKSCADCIVDACLLLEKLL